MCRLGSIPSHALSGSQKKMKITESIFPTLVFPGYFVYHLARPHVMPPNTGIGWFTLAVLAAVAYYGIRDLLRLMAGQTVTVRSLAISVPFYLLMFVMVATVAMNHFALETPYINDEGLLFSIQNILLMFGFYKIGANIHGMLRWRSPVQFAVVTGIYALATFAYFDAPSGTMILPYGVGEDMDQAYALTANYQGMARSVLYTGLLVIPFIESRDLKTAMMVVYAVMLYFIGSRTDFLLFAAVFPLFILMNFSPVVRVGASVGMVLLVIGLVLFWEGGNRFSSANAAASLSERAKYLEAGWNAIMEHPFTGDYLGQIRDFGKIGTYIHNGLSMWSQFGLVAFVIFCYLILVPFVLLGPSFVQRRKGEVEMLLYLAATALIGIASARAITWPMPAMAWGAAVALLSRKPEWIASSKPVEQGEPEPVLVSP